MRRLELDVVVVGAGTAGAATAHHCAERGLSTALVDAKRFERAGAHWVNGIPPWMFERAGIPLPEGAELRASGHRALLLDHRGVGDLFIAPTPIMDVDMRLLVERLQRMAKEAGAVTLESTALEEVVLDGDRPTAIRCRGEEGEVELRAKLLVDGTGMAAVLRRRVPALDALCPEVDPGDLCDAAQQTRRIADRDGARAWLARHLAAPGDAISYLGLEGGFSTLTMTLEPDDDHMEILTGAIADGRYRSGMELIADFAERHPWVGEVVHGGSGRIPLRRCYDRLAVPGLALVGNSGCMVFPTHGSGIGSGLIAARMLAEAAAAHRDDPGGVEATWSYTAAYMHELGSVNAAYDVFRRTTQAMSGDQIAAMMRSGLMSHATSRAALDQRMPSFSPVEVASMGLAGLRSPGIATRMIPAVLKTDRVYRRYRHYPARPDEAELARWSESTAALLGPGFA